MCCHLTSACSWRARLPNRELLYLRATIFRTRPSFRSALWARARS